MGFEIDDFGSRSPDEKPALKQFMFVHAFRFVHGNEKDTLCFLVLFDSRFNLPNNTRKHV